MFIDGSRIQAPAGGEERDSFDVGAGGVELIERLIRRVEGADRITIPYSISARVGVPWFQKGFSGPGVTAHNATGFHANPGVMAEDAIGLKELDLTELVAEAGKKPEVLASTSSAGFPEARADNQDLTLERRRDEKFFFAGKSFEPGAWLGTMVGPRAA